MKKSRFTESQIIKILKEQESDIPVKDIARSYEIGEGSFYSWKVTAILGLKKYLIYS